MDNFVIYPPEPGQEHGPCEGFCSHVQCILKRHDAERECPVCKQVIGWNAKIIFNYRQPVHYDCMVAQMTESLESWKDQKKKGNPNLKDVIFATTNWLNGSLDNAGFNDYFLTAKNRPAILTAGRISD